MLAILPESNARSRRSPGGVASSFVLHLVVALLATVATGIARDVDSSPPDTTPDTVVWVSPSSPIVQRGGGERHGSIDEPGSPAPTIPTPIEVPIGIPPVDPQAPTIDIGPATADVDPRSLLGARRGSGGDRPVGGGGGAHLAVPERVAIALPGNPRPRYPEVLRSARIEGHVLVDCVVDTTGTIDPSSVRIVESDHDHFTDAVRHVLPMLRFAPAETGGRRVRQWVRIPFEFRLSPRTP